jgi:tripartite-type tricarboxylate transporter receptor subunit TctC
MRAPGEVGMGWGWVGKGLRAPRLGCLGPGLVLAGILAVSSASGQDFPTRPVKLVVPFPAGGTADALPRILGDWLSRKWNQPVIVENRAGAGGNIGADAVAKADPDGYTLLATPPSPLAVNQNLYPKLNFDPADFVPVTVMARVPNALVVNPKVPANTVAEFIAYARANPAKLTYASQGNGTTAHLTAELFKMMADVKIVHVPYRGSAPALQDLLAGNVDVMFDNLGVSLSLVKNGQLRLLGVGAAQRVQSLPDVPAINETLPGFTSVTWFAVVAPPKTDPKISAALSADFQEALRQPEIVRRLVDFSAEAVGGTPAEMAAFLREETLRWEKVIKGASIKLETQ